ncbi:hypothetical protein Micbo1qcDRAFT_205351 [Microdochium bolleyi]|uniref:Uncharacterized protein n=1 Tax=Microdochium bolleyi TaxID=196109 RepID=A0A136IZY5_9PEZI|nr:hypothetical protein Micbo1qcDRAFT_205351 [Microdochium bolleyi]
MDVITKSKDGALELIKQTLPRGLPAGYLSSLEQRLVDTENALYFALAEILQGVPELGDYRSAAAQVARPTQSQSKADAIQAWSQWPLNSRQQACEWFAAKHGQAGSAASPSAGPQNPVGRPIASPAARGTISASAAPADAAALQWDDHDQVMSAHEDGAEMEQPGDTPWAWTTPPQQVAVIPPIQNLVATPSSSSPSPSSGNMGSKARSLAQERKRIYF